MLNSSSNLSSVNVPKEFNATVAKYWQYYAAVLAGLEIHERKASKLPTLHQEVSTAYERHVLNILRVDREKLDPKLDKETLMAESFKKNSEQLSGDKIWRKFNDAKLGINNRLSPIWADLTKNGIPSGKQVEDILFEVRKASFEAKERERLASSKKRKTFESPEHEKQYELNNPPKPLENDWYPLEWIAFVRLGPPALGNCHPMFKASISNGPSPSGKASSSSSSSSSVVDIEDIDCFAKGPTISSLKTSRAEQRKKQKVEDQKKRSLSGGVDDLTIMSSSYNSNNTGTSPEEDGFVDGEKLLDNNKKKQAEVSAKQTKFLEEESKSFKELLSNQQRQQTMDALKFLITVEVDEIEKQELIKQYKKLVVNDLININNNNVNQNNNNNNNNINYDDELIE